MSGYCDHCQNMGVVNCYCGGDLCVCENYGEMICPACHGECSEDEDYYDWHEPDEDEKQSEPPPPTPRNPTPMTQEKRK